VRWALIAFNAGVEIVLLATGGLAGVALTRVRPRLSERAASLLVVALSVAAIVGGLALFVARVFFPGSAA
jgi:CHASE2 domain-containing sensor protein